MKKFFLILFGLIMTSTVYAQKTVEIFKGETAKLDFFDGKDASGKLEVWHFSPEILEYDEATKEVTGKQIGSAMLNVLCGSEYETITVNVVVGKLSSDGTYTIGDNITEINATEVQNVEQIKKIVFGKKLEKIGAYAFAFFPNLTGELVIPGNIKSIGEMAFANCPKITSVVLEEGVESLGQAPFNCSDGINKITFPNSLKHVEGVLGLLNGSVDIICDEDSYAEDYFKSQRYYVPSCFKVIGKTLVLKDGTIYFPKNYKGKGTVKNVVLPRSVFIDNINEIFSQDVKIYCYDQSSVASYCNFTHPNYEIITDKTIIPGVNGTAETEEIANKNQEQGDVVGPLLKTVWGQREGKLQFSEYKQASTCEPTAIANLLFYHNISLSGNHYYKTSKKEYFQDFDRFNADYSKCLLDMSKRATNVQHYDTDLLLYNCAIVLNRNWLNATSEYYGIENMLPDYAPVKIIRSSYAWPEYDYCKKTKEEFENIIKENLLQKRPVMYSIHSKDGKWNHLTIIDGYRYSKEGVFEVHVDAGWDGLETKWSPLWGSFDAVDINGLRTYDGERRVIYEFIPLTGAEKENWQPKRVSEADKIKYTKLINTNLFYKHIQAEQGYDSIVVENSKEFLQSTPRITIPVKKVLEQGTRLGIVFSKMSVANSKIRLSEASAGLAKTELTITGSDIDKLSSLELSYYKDSTVLVDTVRLEVPKSEYGLNSACWEIPVPKDRGLYQIRLSTNGVFLLAYGQYTYLTCDLLVYDYPRISEVIAGNVGINAKSDSVKLSVIGEGFTAVENPQDLFILECSKKDIVKNPKVTVVTDRLAYVEVKNPKKKGSYKIKISNKSKKSKQQFTLTVNDYSSWKIGDFIYTDGTRSSKYNSNKSVAAIIFGFTDEGTPLGVSLCDSYSDLGVNLQWAKCSFGDYKTAALNGDTELIAESSFGAWNSWEEMRLSLKSGVWQGDSDGKDNWAIIKSVDPFYSSSENAFEYYPAFAYAENYASSHKELIGTACEKGWYIPTMKELEMLVDASETIEPLLRKIDGSDLIFYANYTSSNSDGPLRFFDLMDQKKYHSCWKSDLCSFRTIRAF